MVRSIGLAIEHLTEPVLKRHAASPELKHEPLRREPSRHSDAIWIRRIVPLNVLAQV
jgi:hypothetical protein